MNIRSFNVFDCARCPFQERIVGHGEGGDWCKHPGHPRGHLPFGQLNIVPVDCPLRIEPILIDLDPTVY